MKFLFLRGQVPRDRNPQEIVFDRIEECDDVWTQLFFEMSKGNQGELWYWGGNREHRFSDHFTERWIPSFKNVDFSFEPDVVFCRGGFPEYHCVLNRFPRTKKAYYGAGRRFLPQKGFVDYDLILQDSPEQLEVCRRKYPYIKSTLFVKPAADNIFFSEPTNKEYDVCFPANGKQSFKGHKFIYPSVPSDLKVLNLGNRSQVKCPPNVESKRVLRSQMREHILKCKVGIVACCHEPDSCPRVIPELIACGLPIVVLDRVRFWKEKYISEKTGVICGKAEFWDAVRNVLNNYDQYSPRSYYEENLSLKKAAEFLLTAIENV